MSDYIPNENPYGAANRMVGGLSDPIFEIFAKLPHLRAELAMSAQKLALQQQEERRMQSIADVQIPNIKSETENHLAQAAHMALQNTALQNNANLQAKRTRLQGYSTSPAFGQMLQDPEQGMQIRQDLEGVAPKGEFNTSMPQLLQMVQSALGATREGSIAGSPAATASMNTPYNTPSGTINRYGDPLTGPPPVTLKPGDTRFDASGKPLFSSPNKTAIENPSMEAGRLAEILHKLGQSDSSDLGGGGPKYLTTEVTGEPVTNTVPHWYGDSQVVTPGARTVMSTDLATQLRESLQGALGKINKSTPTNTTNRVRVKGPNGQTGTIPADSVLPSGWTVIQ